MIRDFVTQNIINVFASIAIGLLNWVFSFLIIRYIPEQNYTFFFTFSSLLAILSFPGAWITLMTVRAGHTFLSKVNEKFLKIPHIKKGSAALLVLFLLYGFLFNTTFLPFGILLIFLVAVGFYSSYLRGLFQRELKFIHLGSIGLLEVVLKVAILVVAIALGWSGIAMYLAITVQSTITLAILWKLSPSKDIHKTSSSFALTKNAVLTLFYSLCFILITNIDLIMADLLLPIGLNADYISLLQIAKLVIFGSSALITVLIPALQKYQETKQVLWMSILTGLGIIAGASFVLLLTVAEYSQVAQFLKLTEVPLALVVRMILAVALLGIAQIPLVLLLIKENRSLPFVVVITSVIQILLFVTFGKDLESFVNIYGLTAITLFISSIIGLVSRQFSLLQKQNGDINTR